MNSTETNNKETELTWLDSYHTLSFDELIKLSGLSQATLQLLIENGALIPNHLLAQSHLNKAIESKTNTNNTNISTWHFSSHHLVTVRTLSRLQNDFELENNSLCLIMLYLERIRTLEAQLQHIDNHNDH